MYYSKQHKYNKKLNFIYRLSLTIGAAILILAWPLSFILPVSISFENGLLENLQIIILLLGSIYNLILIRQSSDRQIEYFHIWCAVFMVFMAFRELSWGRVFYPIGMEDNGPLFIAMSDFQWSTEVHILIVAVILFLTIFMFRNLPLERIFHCHLPFMVIFLMSLAIFSIFSPVELGLAI